MNPQKILTHLKGLRLTAVQILLFTLLLAVCGIGLVSSTAQSAQDDPSASASEEREFKNTIPEHVPLKVKLKNEPVFKKKENKNWMRDFEVEVKNTGSKPIYYLYVIVFMPDVISQNGHPFGIQIHYGRIALVHLDTPLQPEDVPILPGESITLKIPEGKVKAYEEARHSENRPDPKKIEFDLQRINFGDGTGFRSIKGIPDSIKRQSQNAPPPKREPSACPPARAVREAELFGKFLKASYSPVPASFLRVNFSPPEYVSTSGAAQSAKKEREIENKIPSHLPIKIKVKNFEKVKDLENDDWLRDLEIEVTNTGSKPIYYLRLGLSFMDVKKDSGANIGYSFDYGKGRLIDIDNRATPEDIPIEPGASHVFKLHEDYIKGWRYYRTQVEKKPHPKKIEIFFSVINHGDGTGYVTTGGIPLPNTTSSP